MLRLAELRRDAVRIRDVRRHRKDAPTIRCRRPEIVEPDRRWRGRLAPSAVYSSTRKQATAGPFDRFAGAVGKQGKPLLGVGQRAGQELAFSPVQLQSKD